MILDALLLLSNAQAFSADAYTTNTVDLLAANRPIGTGEPMAVLITIDVAADFTTGDETYEFQFVQSVNADLTSHDVLSRGTFTAAQLAAGKRYALDIPVGQPTKRYIGGRFDGSGTTPTVTATIAIVPRSFVESNKIYHPGVF